MIFVGQIDDSAGILCYTYENTYKMDIRSRKAIFSRVDPLWALQPCWPGGGVHISLVE